MNKFFGTRTKATSDCWQTPIYIVESLGSFDLDPSANVTNPTRLASIGLCTGGLEANWSGRVWLNPPYGKECRRWINKLADHGNGIALVPARVGSKWFHSAVFKKCNAILFMNGRISFLNEALLPFKGSNTDSVLIAYGHENVSALQSCKLDGELWVMR